MNIYPRRSVSLRGPIGKAPHMNSRFSRVLLRGPQSFADCALRFDAKYMRARQRWWCGFEMRGLIRLEWIDNYFSGGDGHCSPEILAIPRLPNDVIERHPTTGERKSKSLKRVFLQVGFPLPDFLTSASSFRETTLT